MAEIMWVVRGIWRGCGAPFRAWVRMVEQQPRFLGTLFALSLPLLLVLVGGSLYWAAFYHLGTSLEAVAPRRYGFTTLYWCRAALLLGFATMGLLGAVTALRERLRLSQVGAR
jgi:hypothetical protein